MNKRALRLDKYGISGKRYKELCGFCEQYPEWKQELANIGYGISSPQITDMPVYHDNSDKTAKYAIKRVENERKCRLIEETAKECSPEFWQALINNICYEVPVIYLITHENVYISERSFYDLRRYFFYLLDQKKKI